MINCHMPVVQTLVCASSNIIVIFHFVERNKLCKITCGWGGFSSRSLGG